MLAMEYDKEGRFLPFVLDLVEMASVKIRSGKRVQPTRFSSCEILLSFTLVISPLHHFTWTLGHSITPISVVP